MIPFHQLHAIDHDPYEVMPPHPDVGVATECLAGVREFIRNVRELERCAPFFDANAMVMRFASTREPM